jgi:CubicO group peptidase (beta-lactamase class C family)
VTAARVAALLVALGSSALGAVTLTQDAARVTPESVDLSAVRLDEATVLLRQFVAERKIAGAVAAVARRGKLAYLEAVGVQDLETKAPMTPRSLFRIYSMTKPVTAVAVMMLLQEGTFRLDDPVAKYLPQFRNVRVMGAGGAPPRSPSREMTVQDLLLHTSGLSHRTSELYQTERVRSRAEPMSTFLSNVVRVPLMEDPGTRYRYSEATTVLGRLVEIWSGVPFDEFLAARVFKPLRMVDTGFVVRSDQLSRWTTAYAPAPGGGLVKTETEIVPFTTRPALLEGAVGLVSTVPDYFRFAQMLLNKGELDGVRVLERATVEKMTANGLSDDIQRLRGGSMGWGLANVNVVIDPASPLRGEYGWDGTAGTIFWVDPAREMVTLLMTQSVPANPDGVRQKFKALVQQAVQ